jgi:hypothetical protein
MRRAHCVWLLAFALAACQPPAEPVLDPLAPSASPSRVTPVPRPTIAEADKPTIALPAPPELTEAGFHLITEFEGWAGHPELPDLRFSGVSWGYGYDAHQNSKVNILSDWSPLPTPEPTRLAETQPYYGRSAIQPWGRVRDIFIPHSVGDDVFIRVDMARVDAQCRRAFPGFEELRSNCQSAIRSLVFNRGPGLSGPNRVEMRAIRDAVPSRDYEEIALQLRKMKRVWSGTSIQAGMYRRRDAEAQLVLTP